MELEIVIGEEYKIKIESGNKFKKSIFKDLYKKAVRNVEEIIKQSDQNNTSELSDNVYNNIIAFTGDRGTGKSSSMISFTEAIVDKENDIHKEFFQDEYDSLKLLKSKKISSLPIIDPSLFKGEDKLFEIVVSKMFSKFQQFIKKNEELDNEKKRRLISQFQEVYSNLRIIHEGKQGLYKKEVIEALSDLAYGTNLKSSFYDLINLYLEVIENKSDFLIIAIDDFDLNISGAYDMLEDIRQFLIQKKVIILISCKIEQLKDSVRLEIIKKTKSLYNHYIQQEDGYFSEDKLKEKAEKYLDKLIPLERKLKTEDYKLNNKISLKVYGSNGLLYASESFEKLILELIFQKTKLFITNFENEINPFIPNTLRGLINYISFLYYCNDLDSFLTFIQNQKYDFLKNEDIEIFENASVFVSNNNEFFYEWFDKFHSENNIQSQHNNRRIRNFKPEIVTFYNVFEKYEIFKSSLSNIRFNDLNKSKYLALNYSINNLQKCNDKNEIFNIFNYGIIGKFSDVFPKETINNTFLPRDYFQINNLKNILSSIENIDDFIFILSFISILGEESEIGQLTLSKKIKFKGKSFEKATFSALHFLIILFNKDISYIDGEFSIFHQHDNKSKLLENVKNWNNEKLILFTNIFFFEEFIKNIKFYTRFAIKSTLPDNYGELLSIYLIDGIKYSFDKINIDYPFLSIDTDEIINNPIFNYWKNEDNYNRLNSLIDLIFKDRFNENKIQDDALNEIAQSMIIKYSKYFDSEDFSARGAKQAMNSIVKNFKNYPAHYLELKKFRTLMDRKLEEGILKIYDYLSSL